MDLVRIYRVFQKMMRYPHLLDEIRGLFLEALAEQGFSDAETIRSEARAKLEAEGKPLTEENLKPYADALIDLHFISHFPDETVDDYISLPHKRELFRRLNRVVNTEGATPGKIRKALREFSDTPQGEPFLKESEAEGVRVALINHFISNQLPIIGVAKHYLTIRDIEQDGFTPEVSLGTHFFSDLVEAGIVPIALYPDQTDNLFREDLLLKMPNSLASLVPEYSVYAPVVRVVHLPACTGGRYLQVSQNAPQQKGIGFLEEPAKKG